MTWRFEFIPGRDESEIRLKSTTGDFLPYDQWALEAPDGLLSGVDLIQRLIASDSAVDVGEVVLVKSAAIAGLTSREAASLGLPLAADAILRLQANGLITRPDYQVAIEWARPTGQRILAERIGPWLKIGAEHRRLPEALYAIAEAVYALNFAPAARADERLKALAALQDALPREASEGVVQAGGLIGQMTVAVADAFSVDLIGEGASQRLTPVLHSGRDISDAPLLPEDQQRIFAERFASASEAQPVYSIGSQRYVVLQPPLRKALAEVRRLNGASTAAKRAFMANPRAFLRETLGDDAQDVALDSVFRETTGYAERVVGLGLWTPRVVPWIKLPSTDWLGENASASVGGPNRHEMLGIVVGDRPIALDKGQTRDLQERVARAQAEGASHVQLNVGDETVSVPATDDTLRALHALEIERAKPEAGETAPKTPKTQPEVIIIKTNEGDVEIEADVGRDRPTPLIAPPAGLKTSPKQHQIDGLRWLQTAWLKGVPGVLLADDMGLGKTLQGLAFLAWLREGMKSQVIGRGPLLIVAPTGLLQNWKAEHDKHLAGEGLGHCLEAFGRGLAPLKKLSADGRPELDVKVLAGADWVLTTYETLRDYDKDFGQVSFTAALFDEAQKIKTPGVRITDAAKGMNCDFRVALTGTPVENRLADLWCIMDGVHPGLLGDLKSFSDTYEKDLDAERLKTLKYSLERAFGGRPQVMLRRLKQDHLTELLPSEERLTRTPMPPRQREAYEAAVNEGRAARSPGAMLAILQRLRMISLHPAPQDGATDEAFIAASARLMAMFDILDDIARKGEKALIFLDDLDLQARIAAIIQRRYRLPAPPAIINGSVDGSKRQARVDGFQASPDGFGVMVLSPRAGGVGLTLTRANHAIHLSRWWNPAVEDQCTGRVLRIGQTRRVYVHLPLAVVENDLSCFDENLHALLERKKRLMNEALAPPDATAASDADELFRATIHGRL